MDKLINVAIYMILFSVLSLAITEQMTVIGVAVAIVLSGVIYWAGNRFMKQISILELVHNFILTHAATHAVLEKDVKRLEEDVKRLENDIRRQMDKMEVKMDRIISDIERIKHD